MQEVARLAAPPGLVTAFRRARAPIVASAATYVTFVILGMAMATAGWQYAVDQRDSIVEGAQSSAITQANQKGLAQRCGPPRRCPGNRKIRGPRKEAMNSTILISERPCIHQCRTSHTNKHTPR